MQNLTFAALILGWISILLWGSKYIEWLWVRGMGLRAFRLFVAPGIIVHEYSHALACLLTGTKIHEIKLFKRDGGHVKHDKPSATFLGLPRLSPYREDRGGRWFRTGVMSQFLISFAPVIGCLACIYLMSFVGNQLVNGLTDISGDDEQTQSLTADDLAEASEGDIGPFVFSLMNYVWDTFGKLVKPLTKSWAVGLVYLWLLLSFTVAMAPSERDFLNSIVGMVAVIVLLILVSFAIAQAQEGTLTKVMAAMLPLIGYTMAVMLFALVVTSVLAPTLRAITRGR